MVHALLHHEGVNANIKDNDGNTAIIMASKNGDLEVVHALLHHEGVGVNIMDNDGFSALYYASEFGHSEVVHALLHHEGVDANIKDNDGNTALIIACKNGHCEVVHALLHHEGLDANIKENDGYTALDFAHMNSKGGVARLLVEHMERENLPVENNLAGRGSYFRVTRYPPRRNLNSASSDDAKIEQDPRRHFHGMNTTSAEPLKLSLAYMTQRLISDKRKKHNAEEEQNRTKHAELKQRMEKGRHRLEWFNRTAGSGDVQQLTANPRGQNEINRSNLDRMPVAMFSWREIFVCQRSLQRKILDFLTLISRPLNKFGLRPMLTVNKTCTQKQNSL